MRITYEGESYDFDMTDITVKQAIKIEKYLGCPISEFGSRLSPPHVEGEDDKPPDLMAMQCLGWLILHEGKGVPIEDTDFKVKALFDAFGAAAAAEHAADSAGDKPVPTVAAPASNGQAPDVAVPLTVP